MIKRPQILIPLLILVLLGPICVLFGLGGQTWYRLKMAEPFILPIRGYDPIHPVLGHYFQFQIDWQLGKSDVIECDYGSTNCALCLQRSLSPKPQHVTATVIFKGTEKKHHCAIALNQVQYYHKEQEGDSNVFPSFVLSDEPHRFYVDENDGPILDKLFQKNPQGFSILVKAANDQLYLHDLLINGRPYRDVIREQASPSSSH